MAFQYSAVVGREDLGNGNFHYHSLLLTDRGKRSDWVFYKPDHSVAMYPTFNKAREHTVAWCEAAAKGDYDLKIGQIIKDEPTRWLTEEEFTRLSFFWATDSKSIDFSHTVLEFSPGDSNESTIEERILTLTSGIGNLDPQADMPKRYPAYWRALPKNWQAIDTYRINQLFPLKDDSTRLTHARKKLLVPGGRTGGKSFYHDIKEAHTTLGQWLEENKDQANDPA